MMKRHSLLATLLLILCAAAPGFARRQTGTDAGGAKPASTPAAAATAAATPAVKRGPQKIVREGIEVEFTIDPVDAAKNPGGLTEGQEALVRFKVMDTATKTPLSGVNPSVWLSQRAAPEALDAKACREKIQSYLQGSLRARPDVDLNSYFVLALNQEPNISVIDPLLGFGGSKLLTLVLLKSPGEDWALTKNREHLFVSMPLINQVAVVDTRTWKVIANIDAGMRASRLRLQPDEKYLWVASEGVNGQGSGVTVIDIAGLKVAAGIATGTGSHDIAFSDNNAYAFVTNGDGGTLTIVDIAKLSKVADVKTGAAPSSLAYSPLSKAVYVTDAADGSIAVIDTTRRQAVARIQAKPGIRSVRFAPGGRYGFVPDAANNVVYIFDASTNRLIHTIEGVGKGPDQVAFTGAFAYVRSKDSEEVSLVRLATIGKQPDIVKFPGGQRPPSESQSTSLADSIVPAPEGNSALVANAADKVIYYYSEGMAAPMGNFQNYKRDPRAVMVVDRSLRENTPGVYTTTTKLPKSGNYDVAFLLDSPRVVHCFETAAMVDPTVKQEQRTALRIEYLNKAAPLRVGENYKLRFKLTDPATDKPKDGIKDVRVLTFLAPGIWQKRDFAKSMGEGIYELNVTVPQTGVYMIFVESASQGVAYRQLPYLTLQATNAAATSSTIKTP